MSYFIEWSDIFYKVLPADYEACISVFICIGEYSGDTVLEPCLARMRCSMMFSVGDPVVLPGLQVE